MHLLQFPTREEILGSADVPENPRDLDDWTTLVGVREQVLKALEEARNAKQIGKSLEAQVKISTADPVYAVLARHADQLRYLFIVSAVTLEEKTPGNGSGSVAIRVSKADGRKCERCWNYSTRVGEYAAYPTVCERCSAVLKELEGGSSTSPES